MSGGFWTESELVRVQALSTRGYSEAVLRHLVVKHGESVNMLLALAAMTPPLVLEEILDSGTTATEALQFMALTDDRLGRLSDLRRLVSLGVPLEASAVLLEAGAPMTELVALHALGVDLWVAARMWPLLGACTIEVRQAACAIASCPDPVSDIDALAAARALFPPPAAWTLEETRRIRALGATLHEAADLQQMRVNAADAFELVREDATATVLQLLAVGARPDELLKLSPLRHHSPDELTAAFAQLGQDCRRDEFVTFVSDGMSPREALAAARANEALTVRPTRIAARRDPSAAAPTRHV